MADDGIRHALAFVTSAFGSPSGCRQYLEAIERARQAVGPEAPRIDKLRLFYNHPGFIESTADRVVEALAEIPPERQPAARFIFTAHSIPTSLAARSPYESQLREACRLVMEHVGDEGRGASNGGRGAGDEKIQQSFAVSPTISPRPLAGEGPRVRAEPISKSQNPKILPWSLAFQSRSGPPSQPWLEPDIRDAIRKLHESEASDCPDFRGLRRTPMVGENGTVRFVKDIVIIPIGFLADNIEILYDLDVEVRRLCDELGIQMIRAGTVANHPRFVRMIRELVLERLDPSSPRLALGSLGPWPDECPSDCCR
jgi:protoporphyrin/coproporphyrin ferrochelatase